MPGHSYSLIIYLRTAPAICFKVSPLSSAISFIWVKIGSVTFRL